MAWTSDRSAPYAPLPVSPSRSPSSSTSYSAPPHAPSPRRTQRVVFLCGFLVIVLLGSITFVPQEQLPSHVQTAVSKGKEAFEAARVGVVNASQGWKWDEKGVVEEAPVTENTWVEEQAPVEEGKAEEAGSVDEQEDRPAVVIPLPGTDEDEQDEVAYQPVQEEIEEEVKIICSSELKEALGKPAFWAVTETAPLTYRIAARESLDPEISEVCLSQAVFTARLISPPTAAAADDGNAEQTVVSLPRPDLADDLSSYDLVVPSDLSVPRGEYELDVRLDFGLYVGVLEGTPCGGNAQTCDPLELGEKEGAALRYGGEKVEVVSGKVFEFGQDDLASETVLPLCTSADLSSLDGHWSSLAYHPTTPSPCSLAMPSFPMSFVRPSPSTYSPLWIHLVGDSNTRNMYTHLLNSLGNGGKVNAPKVRDSKTHNGTVASVAFRWRGGEQPENGSEAAEMPDVIISWQWWYEMAPPSSASQPPSEATTAEERAAEFDTTVSDNRDDLVQFVDATLAEYLSRSNMRKALSSFPALAKAARTLRPHRTYLSLGSHGEELTLPGVAASLDEIFSPSSGLSREKRDAANLRLFTTTLVNARYIPLARFPHQDLVRTNAFISAKNAYAAARPELGGEGRVIDVEQLTRGIVEEDGWMKQTKYGPDAVHFRDEVYDEWVRVVWTDLMQGMAEADAVTEMGVDEARKRWKRRIASFEDEDEED
ncbi:hypothetical protein JCM11251_005950 [Rhodosporidiobolus azoricus]